MKLHPDFMLRRVADTWVAVPVGLTCVSFNGMLTLNDSGAMLWRVLEKGGSRTDLTEALATTYDVDAATALADVDEFLVALDEAGCLAD